MAKANDMTEFLSNDDKSELSQMVGSFRRACHVSFIIPVFVYL